MIPGAALEVRTSRASGPGGQHVNKTDSKVSLVLDLEGLASWPEAERSRLRRKLAARLTTDGRLLIHVDSRRQQRRNLEEARRRLAAVVYEALQVPKARRPTRPSKGAVRRRLEAKRQRAGVKRLRGRVGPE